MIESSSILDDEYGPYMLIGIAMVCIGVIVYILRTGALGGIF